MYQYKAVLRSSNEIIAENHTIEDLENSVLHWRRGQKKGEHTKSNEPIDIFHKMQDHIKGSAASKEKLIKTI